MQPAHRAPDGEPETARAPAVSAEGRVLLRLLEHGRGPAISIDWPAGAGQRQRLFRRLTRCHGMVLAILGADGRLYREADPPGTAWDGDLDRYSGFLRIGAVDAGREARRTIEAISRRHGAAGRAVSLFPRAVDAALLGSLRQRLGQDYGATRAIRLRYRLDAAGVALDGVRADGRRLPGAIALPAVGTCRA